MLFLSSGLGALKLILPCYSVDVSYLFPSLCNSISWSTFQSITNYVHDQLASPASYEQNHWDFEIEDKELIDKVFDRLGPVIKIAIFSVFSHTTVPHELTQMNNLASCCLQFFFLFHWMVMNGLKLQIFRKRADRNWGWLGNKRKYQNFPK